MNMKNTPSISSAQETSHSRSFRGLFHRAELTNDDARVDEEKRKNKDTGQCCERCEHFIRQVTGNRQRFDIHRLERILAMQPWAARAFGDLTEWRSVLAACSWTESDTPDECEEIADVFELDVLEALYTQRKLSRTCVQRIERTRLDEYIAVTTPSAQTIRGPI